MQPVRLNAQPVRKRMSPVPNNNPINPLIRRSSKSTSPIIELNSRRRRYYNHNFFPTTTVDRLYSTLSGGDRPPPQLSSISVGYVAYPTTTNLHQGCRATDYPTTINLHQWCRATDYPTTTNLHQGCRATDADCGTSRPFIAIQTTGEHSKPYPPPPT